VDNATTTLSRKAQAGGDTQCDNGNKVVKVAISQCREFEGPEADIIEHLVDAVLL
jgi:hypothetical protein